MSKITALTLKYNVPVSPKEIVPIFLKSGWEYDYGGSAVYLKAEDIDDYRWLGVPVKDFDLNVFLETHGKDDRVAICLEQGEFGGQFHFHSDKLEILLNDDIPLLEGWGCQDLNWCLDRLYFFLDFVDVGALEYSVIY